MRNERLFDAFYLPLLPCLGVVCQGLHQEYAWQSCCLRSQFSCSARHSTVSGEQRYKTWGPEMHWANASRVCFFCCGSCGGTLRNYWYKKKHIKIWTTVFWRAVSFLDDWNVLRVEACHKSGRSTRSMSNERNFHRKSFRHSGDLRAEIVTGQGRGNGCTYLWMPHHSTPFGAGFPRLDCVILRDRRGSPEMALETSRHCTPKRLERMLRQILRSHFPSLLQKGEEKIINQEWATYTRIQKIHTPGKHMHFQVRHQEALYWSLWQLCDWLSKIWDHDSVPSNPCWAAKLRSSGTSLSMATQNIRSEELSWKYLASVHCITCKWYMMQHIHVGLHRFASTQ